MQHHPSLHVHILTGAAADTGTLRNGDGDDFAVEINKDSMVVHAESIVVHIRFSINLRVSFAACRHFGVSASASFAMHSGTHGDAAARPRK